jgi:ankyrin repeat protein
MPEERLYDAIDVGNFVEVGRILKAFPVLATHRRVSDGNVPLHMAALRGMEAVAEYLVKAVGAGLPTGAVPLGWVVDQRHVPRQMNVEVDPKNTKGETPMHLAASVGKDRLVWFLVQNGADVNAQDSGKVRLSILVSIFVNLLVMQAMRCSGRRPRFTGRAARASKGLSGSCWRREPTCMHRMCSRTGLCMWRLAALIMMMSSR